MIAASARCAQKLIAGTTIVLSIRGGRAENPIRKGRGVRPGAEPSPQPRAAPTTGNTSPTATRDRKSTRLNSSHSQISYAVFCLKKKKKTKKKANELKET